MFDRTMLYETPAQLPPVTVPAGLVPARAPRSSENRCPKCGDVMQTGFILDRSHGSNYQEEWVQGRPRSFLFRVILRGAAREKVVTYRCAQCGYLESYAAAKALHPTLDDTVRQAAALSGFWRVARLLLAWLPGSLML